MNETRIAVTTFSSMGMSWNMYMVSFFNKGRRRVLITKSNKKGGTALPLPEVRVPNSETPMLVDRFRFQGEGRV